MDTPLHPTHHFLVHNRANRGRTAFCFGIIRCHWWSRNEVRFGEVYWNGKPSGVGATFILTIFGFGVCLYDVMTPDGSVVMEQPGRPLRKLGVGFFRFVPDRPRP